MWGARSGQPLKLDDTVRVVAREGLILFVEPT
jgi:membrane-bound ClpP family serine protease